MIIFLIIIFKSKYVLVKIRMQNKKMSFRDDKINAQSCEIIKKL